MSLINMGATLVFMPQTGFLAMLSMDDKVSGKRNSRVIEIWVYLICSFFASFSFSFLETALGRAFIKKLAGLFFHDDEIGPETATDLRVELFK